MQQTNCDSLKDEYIVVCAENDRTAKLDSLLEKIIKNEDYVEYDVTKKPVVTNGGSLFGNLQEIHVVGETKTSQKEINLFVKTILLNNETDMTILSISQLYKNELFAYNELSKVFQELEDEAKVPIQEKFKMVKGYAESDKDIIFLENIAKKGYEQYPRLDVVSLEFAEMSIKELAKMHSLSFVMGARSNNLRRKIQSLKQAYIFGEHWHNFVKSTYDVTIEHADDDIKHKIEKVYFDATHYKLKKYFEDDSIRYCLCHGDFKPANIMTNVQNGDIVDIVLIDYQFLHYGCPVFDFLFFIFLSTDRQFRKQHLEHLKQFYYGCVKTYLQYFNIDVESVFPKADFERIYKEKLDYGLFVAFVVLPFVLGSDEPDPNNAFSMGQLKINAVYKERLRGIVEDYIDWGYI